MFTRLLVKRMLQEFRGDIVVMYVHDLPMQNPIEIGS